MYPLSNLGFVRRSPRNTLSKFFQFRQRAAGDSFDPLSTAVISALRVRSRKEAESAHSIQRSTRYYAAPALGQGSGYSRPQQVAQIRKENDDAVEADVQSGQSQIPLRCQANYRYA